MDEQTISMTLEKETKNTVLYTAEMNGSAPATRNVYIEKWALGTDPPDRIEVTITPA